MPLPLAAPIIASAAKFAYGAYQTGQANKKLKGLGPMPEYSVTPEMQASQQRAERFAKMGYTPQEIAAFEQSLAKSGNALFQRGLSIGGGSISQAVNAANNANNIGARLNFAADDARLHRQNMQYADQRGDIISNQRNKDTAQKLAYRLAVEQNLGQAKSQGQLNMIDSISDIPNYALLSQYYGNLSPQEQITNDNQLLGETPLGKYAPTLPQKGLPIGLSRGNDSLEPPSFSTKLMPPNIPSKGFSFGLTKGNNNMYQPSFYSIPQNLSPVYKR